MFKSSFSKYLTAFVIIILVSFFMLSGIITSMIRTQILSDKKEKLEISTSIIVEYFEKKNVENLEEYVNRPHDSPPVDLMPIFSFDYDFNIFISDTSGKIIISSVTKGDNIENKPIDLGAIDIEKFDMTDIDGKNYLVYSGVLKSISSDNSLTYGKPIMYENDIIGYVFTSVSLVKEDRLISTTRRTVINCSVFIMLAAVIATYFITERIIHPLKNMTRVTKKFGKGDFSERVEVYGKDEVAELASAFNNMAESLENLEKMRNSFLANVSHDLRTPMTTIAGFIDGINSGAIPEDQHSHYLGVISSEVHRLSRLVTQLLDISRLESGDRKFVFTNFDAAEVARLILISFEKRIEDKKLNVEFDSEAYEMPAYADKDAIYQVIYNLCENAIKFSKEGGDLRITIETTPAKKIQVTVYDEGQIISEEDRKHVFDRFYKSDKSRGLDKNGVGLGLYICKTIVEAHGEEISVSTDEKGCAFTFSMKQGQSAGRYRSQ